MATQLNMGRFKEAQQYNNNWSAALAADQTLDHALKPDFWAHVARFLRQGDLIRLIPEVNDYYAMLIVMEPGKVWAKVKLIHYVPLASTAEGYEEAEEEQGAEFVDAAPVLTDLSVEWKGPAVRYAVIRKSDGERLKDGFAEKREAEQWMRDHLDAMAR